MASLKIDFADAISVYIQTEGSAKIIRQVLRIQGDRIMNLSAKSNNRLRKTILIILSVSLMFAICGCSNTQNHILQELEDRGYKAEKADDNYFFITEDGVDYYFKTLFNQISFEKAIMTLTPKKDIENLVNNEGKIIITRLGKTRRAYFSQPTEPTKTMTAKRL